ncbi:hypothetical protein KDRO_B00150 [Kluyveromyces lactis]|nr:hypothetical protein KDRO_B00150 [Kluyveromyces lactis]
MFELYSPVKILASVATTLSFGYSSGLVTRTSVNTWYPTLIKPWFTPPNKLFPIAWSSLYLVMGIAAGIVWSHASKGNKLAATGLKHFAVQFGLNMLWSYLFFGLKSPGLGLIEVTALWFSIYKTWSVFSLVDPTAGWLMVPYLSWVSYATVLNASIWWLNR